MYFEKLTVNGMVMPDPFAIDKQLWINHVSRWPPLAFRRHFSVFCFVVWIVYLGYQVLEGFNYFANLHVQDVTIHEPDMEDWCYHRAQVLPSQRQGLKTTMYSTYLVVNKKTGSILTVHCTCMDG